MIKIIFSIIIVSSLCACSCLQKAEQKEKSQIWPEEQLAKLPAFSLKVLCVPF